jgi:hypothetical protein
MAGGNQSGKKNLTFMDALNGKDLKTIATIPIGEPKSLAVDHGVAYVGGLLSGVTAIDFSDPAHPKKIGSYDTEPIPASGVHIATAKGNVYVAAEEAGMIVLRLKRR